MFEKAAASPALTLSQVSKIYKLYASPMQEIIDVIGWSRLFPWLKAPPLHNALLDVSLVVKHGDRVGVIGRNGAGKSTLLRLIMGTAKASSGELNTYGRVQSLSDLGVGFHPEFTGRENVRAALAYNNLSADALEAAVDDIVEFCELGGAIDLPMRTYSAGMMARLYFATATAIRPDILIIDEALGAGDAYFAARSAARLSQLALSGCTLLLVSHSTQQIIEFCERAIWIEGGRIVMEGEALVVVKAYEAFIQRLAHAEQQHGGEASTIHNVDLVRRALEESVSSVGDGGASSHSAAGGVSHWPATRELRIASVWFEEGGKQTSVFLPGGDCTICISVNGRRTGVMRYRAAAVVFDSDGRWATRVISPPIEMDTMQRADAVLRCHLSPLCLGPDNYVVSVSLHEANEPWDLNSAARYDLLSRSFAFQVVGAKESRRALVSRVSLGASWAKRTSMGGVS